MKKEEPFELTIQTFNDGYQDKTNSASEKITSALAFSQLQAIPVTMLSAHPKHKGIMTEESIAELPADLIRMIIYGSTNTNMNKITKAVIPVAGLGTRMLPATKAIPKEMLPLVDKPMIQYIVNECVAAGIK